MFTGSLSSGNIRDVSEGMIDTGNPGKVERVKEKEFLKKIYRRQNQKQVILVKNNKS